MSPLPVSLSSQWASHPTPPQKSLLRPAGMTHGPMKSVHFCPGSQCTHARVCPPGVELLFPPVLWQSCTQAPLDYKAKCSGGSSSWCQTPRLGSLMWDSVLRENFCNIIVLQFVGPTWGVWGLIILWVCPSYHLVGFLHVFGCINRVPFLVGLRLFYWWLVSIQLWLWWASTLPSCPPKYFYVCCISFHFFCLFVWNSTSDTRSCVPRQLIILGWKFKTFLMNFLVLNDAFIFLY